MKCPRIVEDYNTHMGGVDLLDAHLARYKVTIRSRKWYMKIFYHCLDMVCVNSWLIWKKADDNNNKHSLADFKEMLAISLCVYGTHTPTRGRRLPERKRQCRRQISELISLPTGQFCSLNVSDVVIRLARISHQYNAANVMFSFV